MFFYEMHLHDKVCSACGVSSANEMIDAAKERGYAGVVFTNHFFRGNTAIDRSLPWNEFVKAYAEDYYAAKAYGESQDISVLFGIEEVYEPGKEALIYGLSPELISETPAFRNMNIAQMAAFVRKNGGFIACAHPFRDRDYIPDPDKAPDPAFFDAIEVYNFCNHDNENDKALEFAKRYNLPFISGGDTHNYHNFGGAGIAFPHRIKDNKALVAALQSQDYHLIVKGQVV